MKKKVIRVLILMLFMIGLTGCPEKEKKQIANNAVEYFIS
mgnify:CR=1 FL=1